MAFMTKVNTDDGLGTKKFYNFHFPVKIFESGLREDVMLLQALFRILFYEFAGGGSLEPPPGSTGIIKVDGIVGKQTRLHIMHFQRLTKRQRVSKTTDGVIDPFKKQGVLTSHTHTLFQLFILNSACLAIAQGAGREEVHQRMIDLDVHADEIYPVNLRNALREEQFFIS